MGLFDFFTKRNNKNNVNYSRCEEINGIPYKIYSANTHDSAKKFLNNLERPYILESNRMYGCAVEVENPKLICVREGNKISCVPGDFEFFRKMNSVIEIPISEALKLMKDNEI